MSEIIKPQLCVECIKLDNCRHGKNLSIYGLENKIVVQVIKCAEFKQEKKIATKTNPFDTQVGGNHYKQYKIQPYEFFHANHIPHHKAAIIRRILRYDHETGKGLTDLEKIKHEVDLIIELEHEDLTDCQTVRERKNQKEFSASVDEIINDFIETPILPKD